VLQSFVLSYTLSDGVSASADIPLVSIDVGKDLAAQVGEDQWETTVQVPFVQSPVAGRPTTYAIHVRARIYVTNNIAVLYRSDGTGLLTIDSPLASRTFVLSVPAPVVSGPTSLPDPSTIETVSGELLDDFKTVYALEGVSSANAPAAPSGVLLKRINHEQVRVIFPAVPGAESYIVSWYNVTVSAMTDADSGVSTIGDATPLGTTSIPASQQASGIVVSLLDSLLTLVDAHRVSIFKVGVSSVGAMHGSVSQRVVNFLRIPARISSDASYTLRITPALTEDTDVVQLPAFMAGSGGEEQFVWNITSPIVSQLTLNVVPTSPNVQSIQAIFLHTLLPDSGTPFPSCAARISESDARAAALSDLSSGSQVQTLSACAQYAVTVYPLLYAPNVLYFEITAEDFSVHHSQVRITLDGSRYATTFATMTNTPHQQHHTMQTFATNTRGQQDTQTMPLGHTDEGEVNATGGSTGNQADSGVDTHGVDHPSYPTRPRSSPSLASAHTNRAKSAMSTLRGRVAAASASRPHTVHTPTGSHQHHAHN